MDIDASIITTTVAIFSSKELLQKILGPSADYIGGEIKSLVEKCNINLNKIFSNAQRKIGNRINDNGQVSPRVLKHIIDDGKFCENEILTEYYGGVLASARTSIDRDDRVIPMLDLIKSMSVYQLRLHYSFYYSVFNLFQDKPVNLGIEPDIHILISLKDYDNAMDFSSDENKNSILLHSIMGLRRLGLIGNYCAVGSDSDNTKCLFPLPKNGIVMVPTILGAEMFLYALGYQNISGVDLVNGKIENLPDSIIENLPNAKKVQ